MHSNKISITQHASIPCLLHPETPEEKKVRLNLKNMVFPADIDMAKYHAYRVQFQKSHPNMKPSRLQRKVAQKFNIKLVD